jgi:serine/threonine protein kinase
MSPEQACGRELDARSDLFSLGAVAYNLLTGESAFAAPTVTEILERVVDSDPVSPSRVRPGLPPEVDRILARALAKDVADRYPDAKTMANEIREVLGEQNPPEEALVAPGANETHALSSRDVGVSTRPGGDLQDELETLISGLTPLEAEPVSTRTIPPTERKASDPGNDTARFTRRAGLVSLGLVALAGITLLAVGAWRLWPLAASLGPLPSPLPSAVSPTPAATADVSPVASPNPRPSVVPAVAHLAIDFDYPFKDGTLRIFVDGTLSLVEELKGQPDRNFVGITRHKGSIEKSITIRPGRREVKVEVTWEDNVKEDRVSQTFRAGELRRLEIKLGRIRKNLSVEVK